jgi:HAMP domain-containing protein
MAKIVNSLQTKLIASFILLILIVAGGTFFYTYSQTKTAMVDSTREDMLQTIGIISKQFTPQEVQELYQLQPGLENSSHYQSLIQKMQAMRSVSPKIVNIYTMRIDGDNVTFLVDDLYPAADSASIGQQYTQPETRLYQAANGSQVSDNVYTDEFGSYLSGYAPMKDANGDTVIIGADMDAQTMTTRENFIGNTIYIIIGIAVLIAAAIIGSFSVTVVRDIKKLNATADEISKGNTNITVSVKRKDEIGELAESFSRMVASLKFMMADQEETEETRKQ